VDHHRLVLPGRKTNGQPDMRTRSREPIRSAIDTNGLCADVSEQVTGHATDELLEPTYSTVSSLGSGWREFVMICFIDAIGMSVRSRGLTECFGSAILVLDFPPYFNLSGEISAREAIGQPPLTEASFKSVQVLQIRGRSGTL
jgi:hypothetical protein